MSWYDVKAAQFVDEPAVAKCSRLMNRYCRARIFRERANRFWRLVYTCEVKRARMLLPTTIDPGGQKKEGARFKLVSSTAEIRHGDDINAVFRTVTHALY